MVAELVQEDEKDKVWKVWKSVHGSATGSLPSRVPHHQPHQSVPPVPPVLRAHVPDMAHSMRAHDRFGGGEMLLFVFDLDDLLFVCELLFVSWCGAAEEMLLQHHTTCCCSTPRHVSSSCVSQGPLPWPASWCYYPYMTLERLFVCCLVCKLERLLPMPTCAECTFDIDCLNAPLISTASMHL